MVCRRYIATRDTEEWTVCKRTYSKIKHARLLGLAEVLALCYLGVRVQLEFATNCQHMDLFNFMSCSNRQQGNMGKREEERGKTYVQLLVVARTLLSSRLELLAHGADLLVRLGVFGSGHFGLKSSCQLPRCFS
jgi:hypothetical protein